MGSENSMSNSVASSISVPVSKSSAIVSYDIVSKTYSRKKEIDFENLPIKYFKKNLIGCLKDGNDEDILARLGIISLNVVGLFNGTTIDYPDHWFLIAEVTNWKSDIDEMISFARNIIEKRELIDKFLNFLIKQMREVITLKKFLNLQLIFLMILLIY